MGSEVEAPAGDRPSMISIEQEFSLVRGIREQQIRDDEVWNPQAVGLRDDDTLILVPFPLEEFGKESAVEIVVLTLRSLNCVAGRLMVDTYLTKVDKKTGEPTKVDSMMIITIEKDRLSIHSQMYRVADGQVTWDPIEDMSESAGRMVDTIMKAWRHPPMPFDNVLEMARARGLNVSFGWM